jgi:hypothetical protein
MLCHIVSLETLDKFWGNFNFKSLLVRTACLYAVCKALIFILAAART